MKFTERIRSFFTGNKAVSDDFFEELCDLLVEGDMGVKEAYDTADHLRENCKKEKIASPQDVRAKLVELLENILIANSSGPRAGDSMRLRGNFIGSKNTVILLLGVNGVGKTTTAAKLAYQYQTAGFKPILAAADTFRAAAIDQLKIHGQRLGLRVVAHRQGGDPAAVIYDAIEAAGQEGLVIADTAGRMHTKTALVEELRKIDRIVESKTSRADYIKYLVLDATTGRNALAQAEIFCASVSVDAAILTKYDSTAKGGVVFSLASALHLPVKYLCTGENYTDIALFDMHKFAGEFAGID